MTADRAVFVGCLLTTCVVPALFAYRRGLIAIAMTGFSSIALSLVVMTIWATIFAHKLNLDLIGPAAVASASMYLVMILGLRFYAPLSDLLK